MRYEYTPSSSSDGKQRLVNGTVSFAGTDSDLTSSEQEKMPDAWLVPTLAGAVAVGFHLPNERKLRLRIPRETLAGIFLGKILLWSELAEWNPALASVDVKISLVVRADSSGVSEAFTDALSLFSPEWASKVGTNPKPLWPRRDFVGEGGSGVARQILLHPYSLGYVAYTDAQTFGVAVANISNAAGEYVAPTLQSVQAAVDAFGDLLAAMAQGGSQIFFQKIADPKNARDAYPIAILTYVAFDADRLPCEILHNVLFMVYWTWTDPQVEVAANALSFAVMTRPVRRLLITSLQSKLRCGGASPMDNLLAQLMVQQGCPSGMTRSWSCRLA